MNARRVIPWMALLQASLLLPPTLLGSVCISADGRGVAEIGGCDCALAPATPESVVRDAGPSDCGPCRDQDFDSMHVARVVAPDAPVGSIACAPVVFTGPGLPSDCLLLPAHAARPPDQLPILRC